MPQFESPIVKTSAGRVEGVYEAGLAVFKGLPYAAPPVKELRWRSPQPVQPWTGIRQALHFGPSAPQNPSQAACFKEFVVEGPQNEDCLYLNIWTPGLEGQNRPVMVWIHGGVFTMGSGSQDVFDGARLAASEGLVLVTLNYRLGLLGFLNLTSLTGGYIPACGNEGLQDQIAALQWLKENIAAFGGDPENITLFGESAGGASIECLLTMPAARGLFHQAIMQSNIHQFIALPEAVETSLRIIQELGLQPSKTNAWLNLPVEHILSVQNRLNSGGKNRRIQIGPVIDGLDLPWHPLQAFRQGFDPGIPVIIGSNREETRLFQALHPGQTIDDSQLWREVQKLLPGQDPQSAISAYRIRLSGAGLDASPARLLVALQTDLNFRLPALELIEARCQHHPRTYAYQFNWQSPALEGLLGACHAMEIGFIFGNYDESFGGTGVAAERLSLHMQEAWANFARCGNPAGALIGDWPPYCDNHFIKMID
jgi:para-nitrobenzyl esterase